MSKLSVSPQWWFANPCSIAAHSLVGSMAMRRGMVSVFVVWVLSVLLGLHAKMLQSANAIAGSVMLWV